MSELSNQVIESGGIQEQESLESLLPGVDLENFREQIQDIQKNPELYQKLLILVKENLPIKGGIILKRIFIRMKEEGLGKKEEGLGKKEEVNIIERRKSINIAARENTQAIDSINASLAPETRGRLDGKVEKQLQDIQSGKASDTTSEFLKSVGISSPEDIKNPENQAILKARISTQVYLEEARNNPEFRTQFSKEIETLERNAPTLGIEQSATAKSVERLITDMPRDTRGQVVDTVTSLTASNPDTIVTRTGDTLRFVDPQNEKYSYEIDMGKEPPLLAKSLNGLSISRELTPLTQEQKEKQNLEKKKTQILKIVIKDSQAINLIDTTEVIPDTILSSDVVKSYEGAQRRYKEASNPREKLSALKDLKSQNQQLESVRRNSLTTENMGDEKYGKLEQALFEEITGLSQLEKSLSQYIEAEAGLQRYNGTEKQGSIEDFDNFSSSNLSFLVEEHFDRLGVDANTALYRIIGAINNNRDEKNKIRIDARTLNQLEKKTLRDALVQIGATPDVLTNGERLPILQKRITESLRYPRDNPKSIESMLNEKPKSAT